MRFKKENSHFIRFLKDEKFIEWKLMSTDELNKYWGEFLQKHPDEGENLALAEEHFRKIRLSSYKMPPYKKQKAAQRLEKSLQAHIRSGKTGLFIYAAAACAALLVVTLLYVQKRANQPLSESVRSSEYIVGNELESKDIHFITGDHTAIFQEDVDIRIQQKGTAQIKAGSNKGEEISIAQNAMNKLIVPYGKRSKLVLADGTRVWLNSGSTLEFPSTFTGKRRTVILSGEMYIEVVPDKSRSFHVQTSDFNVKVYGTKFNVTSYTESLSSVVLVEGSIGLQSGKNEELHLSPNERAIFSEERSFNKHKVVAASYISWKDGYLTFNDTPILEALKLIERYYNLSFNFDDNVSFKGLTCTGKIILSDNLDNVMTALALISSTNFKRENKSICIYKNKSV